MKKVSQTIVNKYTGDCTRACLASLLEVPNDELPNFIELGGGWFKVFGMLLKNMVINIMDVVGLNLLIDQMGIF